MFITRLELELAFSYLISKSFRGLVSLLSLIGVAIGVASLVVVTSVMDGFKDELLSNVIGVDGHISISLQNHEYVDVEQLRSLVSEVPQISRVVPALEMRAVISSDVTNTGVLIKGMNINDFVLEGPVLGRVIYGSADDFESGIMLGRRLADELGVNIGDEVVFLSASFANTILGPIPRTKRMKVVAIYSLGLVEYDSMVVYMPLEIASTFFHSGINIATVYLDDPYSARHVSRLIEQKMPGLYISNWQDNSNPYFRALKIEKAVMSIILLMIVLVAAFNIISGLFMLVDEKKQSVAILRTMGMTEANIVKIFILSGSIIGLVGTGLGVISGLLIASNINSLRSFIERITGETVFDSSVYFVDKIPVSLDFLSIGVIVLSTLLITFLATIAPAYKAAKRKPGTVLR